MIILLAVYATMVIFIFILLHHLLGPIEGLEAAAEEELWEWHTVATVLRTKGEVTPVGIASEISLEEKKNYFQISWLNQFAI